jgi:hypothetical protein
MNLNFNPHALNPNVEGLNLKRKEKKLGSTYQTSD